MVFGTGLAFGQKFLLQLSDEIRILAMRSDNDAEFLRQLQRVVKFVVRHAERAFVGQENFEAAAAALDDFLENPFRLRRRTASRPCET